MSVIRVFKVSLKLKPSEAPRLGYLEASSIEDAIRRAKMRWGAEVVECGDVTDIVRLGVLDPRERESILKDAKMLGLMD